MLMLFLEQACGRPGAQGHHVGDPWPRLWHLQLLLSLNLDVI